LTITHPAPQNATAGLPQPDSVNLMASLELACGGPGAGLVPLDALPPHEPDCQ
jgi:hypothetical protein